MRSNSRYALYYAPHADSDWGRFGAKWFASVADAPRRYGFHATLKAPFRLAKNVAVGDLVAELERYCGARQAVELPPLKVSILGDFLALVPAYPDRRVNAVAAECVTLFDRFRAPLEQADLARRRPERLGPREREMLAQWGYPYVLDLYRFHMSLTGPLGNADLRHVAGLSIEAGKAIASLDPPVFDSVCVFEEPEPGADFHLLHRVTFARLVDGPVRVEATVQQVRANSIAGRPPP